MTELHYQVKATAAGQLVVPAAYAKAMYDPTLFSHSAAGKITVVADE